MTSPLWALRLLSKIWETFFNIRYQQNACTIIANQPHTSEQTKHLVIVDGNVKFINDTREKLPDPVDLSSVLSSV